MKAKLLLKINVLLGVVAAFFAGCHTQSRTIRDRGPEAMYGVPQEILDQMRKEGQGVAPAPDSTATEQPAPEEQIQQAPEETRPEHQPRKYGPMPPRN